MSFKLLAQSEHVPGVERLRQAMMRRSGQHRQQRRQQRRYQQQRRRLHRRWHSRLQQCRQQQLLV